MRFLQMTEFPATLHNIQKQSFILSLSLSFSLSLSLSLSLSHFPVFISSFDYLGIEHCCIQIANGSDDERNLTFAVSLFILPLYVFFLSRILGRELF